MAKRKDKSSIYEAAGVAVSGPAITAEHIGPIDRFSCPIPTGGGVIELNGRNGSGKSILLRAIDLASDRKADPVTPKDGHTEGKLSLPGVVLRVSRKSRKDGQLDFETIEGKLSISEVIDPELVDPKAADAKRIKAVLATSGAEADKRKFYRIAKSGPKEWNAIIQDDTRDAADYVDMAKLIKRDYMKAALDREKAADSLEAQAAAKEDSVKGIVTLNVKPADVLEKEYADTLAARSELEARDKLATETAAKLAEAREKIDAAKANRIDPEETHRTLERLRDIRVQLCKDFDELTVKLEAARRAMESNDIAIKHAADQHDAAGRAAAQLAEWEKTLLAGTVEPVDAQELAQSKQRALEASDAIKHGMEARRAIATQAESVELRNRADETKREAERLRGSAKQTDEVLSSLVKEIVPELWVDDGRLYTTTEERGPTLFAELSDGQRAKLALRIAIGALTVKVDEQGEILSDPGFVTLEQKHWEGIDEVAKEEIKQLAKECQVCVIVARHTLDAGLSAKVFE